jgi:hypothetical protein
MIRQNSKIQVRTGLQGNLPQLAKGELGWAVDSQRLFIGNGDIDDGAPFSGITEIATVVNSQVSPGYGFPVNGALSGTIDGTNKVFTIPSIPIASTLIIWKNFPLIPGKGYTLNGSTITFTEAPQPGDDLFYFYWKYLNTSGPVMFNGSAVAYGPTLVTGNVDGTNMIFTLGATPSNPDALIFTVNQGTWAQGVDYTLSGAIVSATHAPTANAVIRAYYTV